MSWFSNLFGTKRSAQAPAAQILLTNTLSGSKELFIPLRAGQVLMYSCGPTVYGPAHIGNLRSYVFSDTIARVLEHAGYRVKRVINITDVGHLVSDGDEGEDKMSVGAKREHKSPAEIAEHYTKLFLEDLAELNIDTTEIVFPKATEYIQEQIALAKTLEEKGFAYQLRDGLYFDTSKFASYGQLGGVAEATLKKGARIAQGAKHSAADFALWRGAKPGDLQQWPSPWGQGNPGWHLECSAMVRALLGMEIDIHTGGEDHIGTHHNNEIAQSEAANGKRFVHYWMHNAFLQIQGEKIAKSLGNDITLANLTAKNYHPLGLRYFFLQAHYRTPLSFSMGALEAAEEALGRLWRISREIATESRRRSEPSEARNRLIAALRDDLATPQAIGTLWESLRSDEYTAEQKWGLLETADALLGLQLIDPPEEPREKLPENIEELRTKREAARAAKDFTTADALREELENSGYRVDDGPNGAVLTKKRF